MLKRKRIRERGKLRLSQYFQELKVGDRVGIKTELSQHKGFPKRINGRSGIVEGKKGRSYVIRMMDWDKEKRYTIHPIHLKKLK
jgi:ribosomal protein L21E